MACVRDVRGCVSDDDGEDGEAVIINSRPYVSSINLSCTKSITASFCLAMRTPAANEPCQEGADEYGAG